MARSRRRSMSRLFSTTMWAWFATWARKASGVGVHARHRATAQGEQAGEAAVRGDGKRHEGVEGLLRRAAGAALRAERRAGSRPAGRAAPAAPPPPPAGGGALASSTTAAAAGRGWVRSGLQAVVLDEGHAPHREIHDLGHEAHDGREGLVEVDEASGHPSDLGEDGGLVEAAVEQLVDAREHVEAGRGGSPGPGLARPGGPRPGCS